MKIYLSVFQFEIVLYVCVALTTYHQHRRQTDRHSLHHLPEIEGDEYPSYLSVVAAMFALSALVPSFPLISSPPAPAPYPLRKLFVVRSRLPRIVENLLPPHRTLDHFLHRREIYPYPFPCQQLPYIFNSPISFHFPLPRSLPALPPVPFETAASPHPHPHPNPNPPKQRRKIESEKKVTEKRKERNLRT